LISTKATSLDARPPLGCLLYENPAFFKLFKKAFLKPERDLRPNASSGAMTLKLYFLKNAVAIHALSIKPYRRKIQSEIHRIQFQR